MGENFGDQYTLDGKDANKLTGGGEGGSLYRCRADGSKIERIATGFWNPYHHCFDSFGRLFLVDNDPDDRPPCRLLHIVEGGDYGYRFRNGRKGTHPFTSWNGELPGTLPMVAGTGEAPSGMVYVDASRGDLKLDGSLIVTSWGDHRLESYRLEPRGASFTANLKPMVVGDEDFRPVGIAWTKQGDLVVSDWVDKSYNVHGKGRVWLVRRKTPAKAVPTVQDKNQSVATYASQYLNFARQKSLKGYIGNAGRGVEGFLCNREVDRSSSTVADRCSRRDASP